MIQLSIASSDDNLVFAPEDIIRGRAAWTLPFSAQYMELRLFWYTEGKGDCDLSIVNTIRIENFSSQDERPFEFRLPPGPYSFHGKLISLIWCIEVIAFPTKESTKIEFVMSPNKQVIGLHKFAG